MNQVSAFIRKGIICTIVSLSFFHLSAQVTTMKDYVLFGGSPSNTTGYLQLGSSTTIQGGAMGSYNQVRSTGNSTMTANIYSGGTVQLANSNVVNGRIGVANLLGVTGTILSVGSSTNILGRIDVNGNTVIGGGTISGSVTHPAGTTYSGPIPAGGNIIGSPQLPSLPVMYPVTAFPAVGATSIFSTQTIAPGAYFNVALGGGKTLTLSAPGIYVFNSIKNSGTTNNINFDFNNSAIGTFRVYVYGDVDLNKIKANLINGGSASRIFFEVHGTGATLSGGVSFNIANGSAGQSSKWLGTVWAPSGGVSIGAGTGSSDLTGALWSRTFVNVQSGCNVVYEPYNACTTPDANAGPDKELSVLTINKLNGSSATVGAAFSWQALNGGIIKSGANTATPVISTAGTYVLTVTTNSECFARDTVIITGKINNLIGSELNSLYLTRDTTSALSKTIFITIGTDVLIDIIAIQGKYTELKTLLLTAPYGLTDTISNGPGSLIITGRYPIDNLLKLNNLSTLINHCRPAYPAIGNSGIIQTAGDSAMRTNYVRDGFNLGGQGIKIGVISDSYNTLANNPAGNDVINGDLPGIGNINNPNPVHVLKEYPYGRRSDEGRAMMQIAYDVAPKSTFAFRTGFLTAGDFAQGIRELGADNCNVIVDDITYITEPFFKSGVVESAINEVTAAGISYVTAAGNFGNKSYESVFNPVAAPAGLPGKAHLFSGTDILQSDSVKGTALSPGVYTIVLQWVDDIYSLGGTQTGTQNDLDIYLASNDGNSLYGVNRDNLGRDPIEVLSFTITSDTVVNILVVNASATSTTNFANLRFKYVVFRGNLKINEYQQGSSTIVGQGNTDAAITVGAALYANTPAYGVNSPTVASFSSIGGTLVNNVVKNKPDLVGPNGVNTSVNFGSIDYDGDGLPNFFGTSAAAPHVAGAVALLLEAKRKFYSQGMTSAEVKSLFVNTAIDMYGAGFDFKSGFGFIQADSAVRSIANPKPFLIKIALGDSSLVPGVQPMPLIITGNYLSFNTKFILGTDTLPSVIINNSTATVTLPAFTGEKFISAYTVSRTPSLLDGGTSNAISITSLAKKKVQVIANNKTNKYGEVLPSFTSTILLEGDSLQKTAVTPADLGLSTISYSTPAVPGSNVGIYYIRPARVFNAVNSADSLLLTKYNYTFTDGALSILKLPVTIVPRDTTLVYGQKIGDIHFNYSYDPTAVIADRIALANTIQSGHESEIATNVIGLINSQAVTIVNGQAIPIVNGQAVTIVNGQAVTIVNGQAIPIVNSQAITIVNGQAITIVNNLTDAQTQNLSFLATAPTLQNARQIPSQTLVNGNYVQSTTNVVDITQESIIGFNKNSAQTSMTSSVSNSSSKGLADVESISNGQAITIVNSQAITIVNAQAITIVNGQAVTIVNGQAVTIVNGQAIPIVNGANRTAVVVDQADIGNGLSPLKSINMITGLTNGVHSILPAAFISDNFELSYGLGKLTILPAPITIKANDTTKSYGTVLALNPAGFTVSVGKIMYLDSIQQVSLTSAGLPATANGGTYPIMASAAIAGAGTDLSNYTVQYAPGVLTINRTAVIVKANDATKVYGDANPAFSGTYTGLLNGQTFETSGITGSPSFSSTAVIASGIGTYPISGAAGSLLSANYNFSFSPGTLTITKALLNVKAVDTYIYKGDALPSFSSVFTTLKAGDNPAVTYRLSPVYAGEAGLYIIVPLLSNFVNDPNYIVTYTNGNFYVNPKGNGAKKLRPYLDCVEELLNPTSPSRRYIAHFFCVNDNATPLYVPIGIDNKISSTGSFDNSRQPVVFMPGNTVCNVPFDGIALKWEVRTYETTHKTSVSSDASSGSNKCTYTTVIAKSGGSILPADISMTKNKSIVAPTVDVNKAGNISVFPNPAMNKTIVRANGQTLSEKAMSIVDVFGRTHPVKIKNRISAGSVEIDLSSLVTGVYFIKVKMTNGYKSVAIVKQ